MPVCGRVGILGSCYVALRELPVSDSLDCTNGTDYGLCMAISSIAEPLLLDPAEPRRDFGLSHPPDVLAISFVLKLEILIELLAGRLVYLWVSNY